MKCIFSILIIRIFSMSMSHAHKNKRNNDSSPTNTKQKEVTSISHLYTGSVYKEIDIQARAALRFSFFAAFRRSRPATLRPRGIALPVDSPECGEAKTRPENFFPLLFSEPPNLYGGVPFRPRIVVVSQDINLPPSLLPVKPSKQHNQFQPRTRQVISRSFTPYNGASEPGPLAGSPHRT